MDVKRKAGRPKGAKDSYPRAPHPLNEKVYARVTAHVAAMIDYVASGSGRTRSQVISDTLMLTYHCECEECRVLRRAARARAERQPRPRSFLKGGK